MAIQTNLTAPEVLAQLDALRSIGPEFEVQFADRKVTYRSMTDVLKQITMLETILQGLTGGAGSRVSFAQHKRGDGPSGPRDRWDRE